jgi:hypothetical protein
MGALGAYDGLERRDALTAMGVKAQILFANNSNVDLLTNSDEARAIASRYNDYAIDFTKRTKNRARRRLPDQHAERRNGPSRRLSAS